MFNRAAILKTIVLCCMFCPCLGPRRSCPLSPLDPYCSQEETEACLYRQTAELKDSPCMLTLAHSAAGCCVGMALSKPPGSGVGVGERWIGLIYASRGAAGKFNDPPYCQHHKALFLEGQRCHGDPGSTGLWCMLYKFKYCSHTVENTYIYYYQLFIYVAVCCLFTIHSSLILLVVHLSDFLYALYWNIAQSTLLL